MKIFKMSFGSNDYEWLQPIVPMSYDEIHSFDGRSHIKDWKPIKVKKMESDECEKRTLPLGDAPNLSFAPAFSKRSKDALLHLIKDDVEILNLDCNEGEYYCINIIKVLDVIDYSKSIYTKYKSSGRIMDFIKYSFVNSNELNNTHIFKIKDKVFSNRPFVSESFKKCVEDNELEGFVFEEVWDSKEN